jgi:hypothetical protein
MGTMMTDVERARLSKLENILRRVESQAGSAGSATGAFVSVKAFGAKGTGTGDDGPAFQNAMNIVSLLGVTLWVPAGTYRIASTVRVPTGLRMRCEPQVTFLAALLGSGSPSDCIFYGAGGGQTGLGTTLNGAPAQGGNTIVVTDHTQGPIVNGSILLIADLAPDNLRSQTYTVIAGGGTNNLTLDRPILFAYQSGGAVTVLRSVCADVEMDFGGALFTGHCTRFIEFAGTVRCHLRDARMTATDAAIDIAASYDVAGRENSFDDFIVDGGTTGCYSSCLALESQENSTIRSSGAHRPAGNGITLYDCLQCVVDNCKAYEATASGIVLTADGNTIGCLSCVVTNSAAYSCTQVGLQIDNGSTDSQVTNVTCRYNTTFGLYVTGNGPCRNSLIANADLQQNTSSGLVLGAAFGTHVENIDISGNGNTGMNISGELYIDGIVAQTSGTNFVILLNAGAYQVKMRGLDIGEGGGGYGGLGGISVGAGVELDLSDSNIVSGTGATPGIVQIAGAGSLVSAHDVTVNSASIGWHVTSGSTARIGSNVNLQTSTTPLTVDAGAFCSRKQTFIAAGAGFVNVPWPNIKADDVVAIQAQTLGGTPGVPLYAITPGVHISFTSQALDTTTYEYCVS